MAKTNEDDVSDSEDDVPLIQFLQPNQRLRTAEVRNGKRCSGSRSRRTWSEKSSQRSELVQE
ncbi:uncharacterized protein isoform X4 [Leptinotarsa decemlineata]|uniref:uncharacterized protein isoform X4 n=1 Tax=Leptinotarsa decemlineata TaxID=7539 RepID=UPI003D306F79